MTRRGFLKRMGGGLAGMLAAPGILARPAAAPAAWKPAYWTKSMQRAYNHLRERFIQERVKGFRDAAGVFHPPVPLADAKARWAKVSETYGKVFADKAHAIHKKLLLHRGELVDWDPTGEKGFLNPRPNPEGDAIEAAEEARQKKLQRQRDEQLRRERQQQQRPQHPEQRRQVVTAIGRNERQLPREQMESLVDALLE